MRSVPTSEIAPPPPAPQPPLPHFPFLVFRFPFIVPRPLTSRGAICTPIGCVWSIDAKFPPPLFHILAMRPLPDRAPVPARPPPPAAAATARTAARSAGSAAHRPGNPAPAPFGPPP